MQKEKNLIDIDVSDNPKKFVFVNWKLILQTLLFQILICFILFPIIINLYSSLSFNTPIIENKIIVSNCSIENPINSTINSTLEKILMMASNVSNSHKFVLGIYDCSQFSQDLVKNLTAENISAYCVYGYYKNDGSVTKHTWVQSMIENKTYNIEATGGFIIEENDFKLHYQQYGRGVCW